MTRGRLTAAEIQRGLVLYLDPETLLVKGAVCTSPRKKQVVGKHRFVVVSAENGDITLMPLYSRSSGERIEIPKFGRRGHPQWTQGEAFAYPRQIWRADAATIVAAFYAAGDLSTSGTRSTVLEAYIPEPHIVAT